MKLPGGLFTNRFPTSFGVKQGDNLSPTLFSVFLNDLAKSLKKKLDAGVDTSDNICNFCVCIVYLCMLCSCILCLICV